VDPRRASTVRRASSACAAKGSPVRAYQFGVERAAREQWELDSVKRLAPELA
jgi:hypothetical protein